MDAIVYTSNTGFTAEYAKLLGEKTGLPVYPLGKDAPAAGAEIIYLGWLMAGNVRGYQKAAKRYRIRAVCGVGMGADGTQDADVRKANHLPDRLPVYTMQGGFDLAKLRGIYKFMMTFAAKGTVKSLAEKRDRTPEEEDMLALMRDGGSRVRAAALDPLLSWYSAQSTT